MLESTKKFIAWQDKQEKRTDEETCRGIDKYTILLQELKKRVNQKYIKLLQEDQEADVEELSANLSFGGSGSCEDEPSYSIGGYGDLDMDGMQIVDVDELSDEDEEDGDQDR